MFKKKLLIKSGMLLSGVLGVSAVAAACSKAEDTSNKEIIIAVDGAQKAYYDKVVELFNQTDSAKAGYKIKLIQKNVFDAVNTEVGITDPQVPDIFYAPQDRVTDLAVKKSVIELSKFDPNFVDEIATLIGATPQEKEDMIKFGSVTGKTGTGANTKIESKLFAIRHNVEGIVLASTKTKDEALAELKKDDTNSLEELVQAGKAIVRLQDFWYGNGILGGVFAKLQAQNPELSKEDLMGKILYANNAKTVSGFVDSADNKYFNEFKEGVEVAARLYYPVYRAAYLLDEGTYQSTVWAQKGISQADLKAVLTNDMGTVQNKIFELMKQGKIDYAIIGTWDLQVSENTGGAKSFFNVINTTDDYEYRQASGAWSFLINNRNANASEGRKTALKEIIKIALGTDANFEYFKADSKVQFTVAAQSKIKGKVIKNSEATAQSYRDFYKSLGYNSHEELLAGLQEVVSLGNSANATPFYLWETGENKDQPLNDVNVVKSANYTNNSTINDLPKVRDENKTAFIGSIKDQVGLRNALAAMFGKKLSEFQSPEPANASWWISTGIVKDAAIAKYAELKAESGFHLRKIEKYIFGADGDNNDDKVALVAKLVKAIDENTLEQEYTQVENKAIEFIKEVAVSPVSDDVIKQAARLYLNGYVNQALWQNFIKEQVKEVERTELPEGVTVAKIQSEVSNFLKTLSFDKLLEVLSSNKSIEDDGLGVIKFQANRIDNSNPILGASLWQSWNDQTFGNAPYLDAISKEEGTKDLAWFQRKMVEKLSERFGTVTKGINSQSGSSTIIDFEK